MVREYTARLVNVMATEVGGRTYLLAKGGVIPILLDVLKAEGAKDTVMRQNVLGSLQKFSLRRQPQSEMIDIGAIPWLIMTLKEVDNLSEYTLEYTAALLMNLSLRTAGKQACQDPGLEVLTVLSDLLENDNMQVRTYVNGTLYSILTRPSLRDQAQEVGLKDILEALEPRCEEQFARQIRYIIQQLSSDAMDGTASDDEEGDDDNDDDEEDEMEEDEEETVEAGEGMVSGEELLCGMFLANEAQANKELEATAAAVARQPVVPKAARPVKEGLLGTMPRPSTPSSRPGSKDGSMTGSFPSRQQLARTPFVNDGRQRQPSPSKKVNAVLSPVGEENEDKANSPSRSPGAAGSPGSVGSPASPSVTDKALRCAPPSTEKLQLAKEKAGGAEVTADEFNMAFVSRPKMPRTP